MRVLFVLPAPVRVPMGGAAVVYRHAGGLARRGHDVTVAAPKAGRGPRAWAWRGAVRARDAVHGVPARPAYGARGVATVEPSGWRDLRGMGLDHDAVIATGYQTTPWVLSLTTGEGPVGVSFLQGDERALHARAGATWALPLVRIAVSEWLADRVRGAGHDVAGVVPNAVDPEAFAVDRPVRGRPRHVVALYHRHPVKGPDVLVETLRQLGRDRPDVGLTVFSARPPRHRLPAGVEVVVRPDARRLRALYNRASVCVHTSRLEGWGLAAMEAAACGCAVVATASLGPREYLEPGRSMVEVPVGDADAVAREARRLLDDGARRGALAEAAVADVARFSWDDATDTFEQLLLERVTRR